MQYGWSPIARISSTGTSGIFSGALGEGRVRVRSSDMLFGWTV